MKIHWNNKGRIILSFKLLALCSMFLALCLILCLVLCPDRASSGPYLNSAHGSSSYGVNRSATGFPTDFTKGNCIHCHEQHAGIGGSEPAPNTGDAAGPDKYCLLANSFNTSKTINPYVQSDSVCFYCHIVTDTFQSPTFYNYNYSATFGVCSTIDCPTANIFDTFNSLSYHNLYDVYRFITGLSGSHSNFTNLPSDSNPCSGCHNIHIAQKSCGKPSGSFDITKSAISKPSDHSNLWGNTAGEKMSNYTTGYQSPYYNSAIPTYEPDSSITSDPSKLPDYVTFCTDCHNATNTIYSTLLARNLYKFNWANEMHGGFAATYCSKPNPGPPPNILSLLAAPYEGLTRCGQYVLACTDCHEPHGSPNNFLVRKQVNNGMVTVINNGTGPGPDSNNNKEWVWLCGKCHTYLNSGDLHTHPSNLDGNEISLECTICHTPGTNYRNCQDCHFHGNNAIPGYPGWINPKPLF